MIKTENKKHFKMYTKNILHTYYNTFMDHQHSSFSSCYKYIFIIYLHIYTVRLSFFKLKYALKTEENKKYKFNVWIGYTPMYNVYV